MADHSHVNRLRIFGLWDTQPGTVCPIVVVAGPFKPVTECLGVNGVGSNTGIIRPVSGALVRGYRLSGPGSPQAIGRQLCPQYSSGPAPERSCTVNIVNRSAEARFNGGEESVFRPGQKLDNLIAESV